MRRTYRGATLVEVLFAVAIFAITILGFILGLLYVQRQNRVLTQQELASGKAIEILELFKNLNYDNISYSTDSDTLYLKRLVNGTGDPDWKVPKANQWVPLRMVEVQSNTAGNADEIDSKLPNGEWTVEIQDIEGGTTVTYDFRRVAITIRWHLIPDSDTYLTYSMETYVAPGFSVL